MGEDPNGEKENSWQSGQTCTRGSRRANAHRDSQHTADWVRRRAAGGTYAR